MTEPTATSHGIELSFTDTLRELAHMRNLAQPFLERTSYEHVLPRWIKSLEQFQTSERIETFSWTIPLASPIRTCAASDELCPKKTCGLSIFAEIAATWEISAPKGTKNKPKRPETFWLKPGALASTMIRLRELSENKLLAQWKFDAICDHNAPGCPFHGQVEWNLPVKLDFPRYTGFVVTPMDALAFTLGELFQEVWERQSTGDEARSWARLQSRRLVTVLNWYIDEIRRNNALPWILLRNARPTRALFTSGAK